MSADVPVRNRACVMKMYAGMDVKIHTFLTPVLDRG